MHYVLNEVAEDECHRASDDHLQSSDQNILLKRVICESRCGIGNCWRQSAMDNRQLQTANCRLGPGLSLAGLAGSLRPR